VALTGLVTNTLDVVLLFGALLGGELVLSSVLRTPRFRSLFVRIPYPLRFVVAFVATFIIAYFIMANLYRPAFGSEFFPLVLSLAVGFLLFHLLLGVDEAVLSSSYPPNHSGTGTALLIAIGFFLLAEPSVVFADNCSGLSDCAKGSVSCTAAGIAAIVASIWTWIKSAASAIWDWIEDVFSPDPLPPGFDPLDPDLAPPAMEGWVKTVKEMKARQALQRGDEDEYYRIRNMSTEEYLKEFGPPPPPPNQ
jgi:hypothetical protein